MPLGKKGMGEGLFPSFDLDGMEPLPKIPSPVVYHGLLFHEESPEISQLPLRFAEWGEVFRDVKNTPAFLWICLGPRSYRR